MARTTKTAPAPAKKAALPAKKSTSPAKKAAAAKAAAPKKPATEGRRRQEAGAGRGQAAPAKKAAPGKKAPGPRQGSRPRRPPGQEGGAGEEAVKKKVKPSFTEKFLDQQGRRSTRSGPPTPAVRVAAGRGGLARRRLRVRRRAVRRGVGRGRQHQRRARARPGAVRGRSPPDRPRSTTRSASRLGTYGICEISGDKTPRSASRPSRARVSGSSTRRAGSPDADRGDSRSGDPTARERPTVRPHRRALTAGVVIVDQLSSRGRAEPAGTTRSTWRGPSGFTLAPQHRRGVQPVVGQGRGSGDRLVAVIVVVVIPVRPRLAPRRRHRGRGPGPRRRARQARRPLLRSHSGFLQGGVVDFIDFQWWPVFDVADACIVVGAIALGMVAVFRPSLRYVEVVPHGASRVSASTAGGDGSWAAAGRGRGARRCRRGRGAAGCAPRAR